MRKLSLILLCLLSLGAPRLLAAQVTSGPSADAKIGALKVVAATGDSAGKEVDFAAERKEKPTIYAFVQADKWDRPVARFLKTIDQELAKSHNDVQVVAVWLTDNAEASKAYLPRAQDSLKFEQTTLAVFPGEKKGPDGWGINSDAYLTVVVAENQRATARFGYRSVNETDAPSVLEKLKKPAGK